MKRPPREALKIREEKSSRPLSTNFTKNGFQGGSLNRIVVEARTTKGAVFHHFKGKKDLGYAVVREVIHPRFNQQWSDPLANSTDPITD